MTGRIKGRLLAAGTFALFALMAEAVGSLFGFGLLARWILRGGFWLLGAASAFLMTRLFSGDGGEDRTAGDREPEKEIDEAFAEAGTRLSESRIGKARIGGRPVVLLLGPRGSTKTTLIERSGVETELLVGEVYRGDTVVPTDLVNVWYGGGTLFIEAGGGVFREPGRWGRLVDHLRPDRLAAALGRRRQAPRQAIVCFPCDEFLEKGRADDVPAAAKQIRERLQELSRRLGIRLPVYVVFTRTDRLPHFEAYLGPFTSEEARQVLGATLPLDRTDDSGTWTQRESARLSDSFDRLFRSLAARRVELMGREGDRRARGGIYEFPRELRKLRDLAVRFLVELCRPSQLAVSPVLRGYYFTGVRPVVVDDDAAREETPDDPRGGGGGPVGATAVFDASAARGAPAASPSRRGERRIPEWAFLGRLFPDVILADRVAMAATGGGTQVNLLRRLLVGSLAVLGLLLVLGFSASFLWNRGATRDASAALVDLEEAGSLDGGGVALPSPRDMERLNAVGGELERLRRGGPWWAHLGLYRGDDLLREVRQAYFARFEDPLAVPARNELRADLGRLEAAAPGSGAGDAGAAGAGGADGGRADGPATYQEAYDALKAYLMLTEYPDSADARFLADVLTPRRLRVVEAPDSATRSLTWEQYALYGAELPHGNPYRWEATPTLVDGARSYLRSFSGVDQLYRRIIATAAARESTSDIRFQRGGVVASRTVPAAYTREGWSFIRSSLDENVEALLEREEWVTEEAFSPSQVEGLKDTVWNRYVRDYTEAWRSFLGSAEIQGLWPLGTARRTLEALAGNRSPLLQLLALVTYHTDVGSEELAAGFRPVRAVMPADTSDEAGGVRSELITPQNEAYQQALGELFRAVDEAADARREEWGEVLPPVLDASRSVQEVVFGMRQGFGSNSLALPVEERVVHLLDRPADVLGTRAEGAIEAGPVLEARAALRELCAEVDGLAGRYPFSPRAAREAAIEDLGALLEPESGLLWAFPGESGLLERRGSRWVAHADAEASPSRRFVDDFNEWAAISRALYGEAGSEPRVRFSLRLEATNQLPSVTLNLDGRPLTFEVADFATQTATWDGSHSFAVLRARRGGRDVDLLEFEGPWALFRLFGEAEWSRAGGEGRWNVAWNVEGTVVEGELTLRGSFPILNPGAWPALECHPTLER